jgi:hypothetical protein
MNGFLATASMASEQSYSSFVPSCRVTKMYYFSIIYMKDGGRIDWLDPHSKFAPAHLLCDAQ